MNLIAVDITWGDNGEIVKSDNFIAMNNNTEMALEYIISKSDDDLK